MKTKNYFLLVALICTSFNVAGQNLLENGDFENSIPNGTFPASAWRPSWYPEQAGSVTTTTAARSGKCGLWMYTAFDGNSNSFSKPNQDVNCTPLVNYRAEVYLRTPKNQSWGSHSYAYLKIEFKNSSGFIIKSACSDSLKTGNTDWKLYTVSLTAPKGAVKIRFAVNLESRDVQSICNVDDCSLFVF
jgi:hypothetical protein